MRENSAKMSDMELRKGSKGRVVFCRQKNENTLPSLVETGKTLLDGKVPSVVSHSSGEVIAPFSP